MAVNTGHPKRISRSGKRSVTSEDRLFLLNRDLSWLEFNGRVLQEGVDPRTPILERLKFLSIFSSNLDEFVATRVGRLKRLALGARRAKRSNGRDELLASVRERMLELIEDQAECYRKEILPVLAEQGVEIKRWRELRVSERQTAEAYFSEYVLPLLTPFADGPGHPFPKLATLTTSIALRLCKPNSKKKDILGVVALPTVLPGWLRVDDGECPNGVSFVSMLEIVRNHLDELFPGMEVLSSLPFRITRSAWVDFEEAEYSELRDSVGQALRRRQSGKILRLEIPKKADPELLAEMQSRLKVSSEDVVRMPAELDFSAFSPVYSLKNRGLSYQEWKPNEPLWAQKKRKRLLALIRENDQFVHHPYDCFDASVVRFVREAVEDPKVLSIKMTLYRTGDKSPFIPLLVEAAKRGKQTVCLIEFKARFEEERNMFWAKELEDAGVQVVHGLPGIKTHSKTILVVRQEKNGLRRYAHIASGNYHAETARLYTDVGLFTCDEEITADLIHFFNYLTGHAAQPPFNKLLVAPFNMKQRFLAMIQKEIEYSKQGKPAHIVAKVNSLEDRAICQALYRASQSGVQVDLLVRGICVLRPGVPGLSENIRVISIVGRLLEHSRLFYFRSGAENPIAGKFFLGSADWMKRNLDERAEVVVPVEDWLIREQCWEILQINLQDQRQAWVMDSDGAYIQRAALSPSWSAGTHSALMGLTSARSELAQLRS